MWNQLRLLSIFALLLAASGTASACPPPMPDNQWVKNIGGFAFGFEEYEPSIGLTYQGEMVWSPQITVLYFGEWSTVIRGYSAAVLGGMVASAIAGTSLVGGCVWVYRRRSRALGVA